MKSYRVAILGASGAVGKEMLKVLEEYKFPIGELRLLSSKRSAGTCIHAFGEDHILKEANAQSFNGIDIVLSAATNEAAKELLPYAVKAGALVIDNSSAFRLQDDVPLIIPEVNKEDIKHHHGIIANPNCSTIVALTAVAPLHRYAHIKRMIVSTYQAVSGAGLGGIAELKQQIKDLEEGNKVEIQQFPYQIAYNLIPQIGDFDELGYTGEEMKMQNEGRKILHDDNLLVNCTCVRVPIIRSHSESITLEFEKEIDVENAKELLAKAPGVKLVDDVDHQQYPMPLDTSGQDLIYVGRIRKDISSDVSSLVLWCCGDQIRKGAAANAVQIALAYIEEQENKI